MIKYLIMMLLVVLCLGTQAHAQNTDPFAFEQEISGEIIKKEDRESFTYEIINWNRDYSNIVLKFVYENLSNAVNPLLLLMTMVLLITFGIQMITGNAFSFVDIIKITAIVILVDHLLLSWSLFRDWLYFPMMNLMLDLPAYLARELAIKLGEPLTTKDPLKGLLMTMDAIVTKMIIVGDKIAENEPWYGIAGNFIAGKVLKYLYLALLIILVYTITIAIWVLHLLLMCLPLTLPFAVFPSMRKYTLNILHYSVMNILTPFIAILAALVTMIMMTELIKDAEIALQAKTIPEAFYTEAIVYGALSFLFILKANSISSMVMGTPDNGFGQAFAAGIAGLFMASKLGGKGAALAGSVANPPAGVGMGAVGKTVSTVIGGAEKVAKASSQGVSTGKRYLYGKVLDPNQ